MLVADNPITSVMVDLLNCRPETIDGNHYLAASMDVECYSASHIVAICLIVPASLLYTLGLPLFLVLFVKRNRRQLHTKALVEKYGFMYQGYSVLRGLSWWEAVQMLKKSVCLLVATTIPDASVKSSVLTGLLVTFIVLQLLKAPYDAPLHNGLETLSLLVLIFSHILLATSVNDGQGGSLPVSILLIIINTAMIVILGALYIHAACLEVRQKRRKKGLHSQASKDQFERATELSPLQTTAAGAAGASTNPPVSLITTNAVFRSDATIRGSGNEGLRDNKAGPKPRASTVVHTTPKLVSLRLHKKL